MHNKAAFRNFVRRTLELDNLPDDLREAGRQLLAEPQKGGRPSRDVERRAGLPQTVPDDQVEVIRSWGALRDHPIFKEKAGVYLKRFGRYAPRAHTILPEEHVDQCRIACSKVEDELEINRVGTLVEWLDNTGDRLDDIKGIGEARADALYLYLYRIFGYGGVDIRPAADWDIPTAGVTEPPDDYEDWPDADNPPPRASMEKVDMGTAEISDEKDLRPDPPEAPESDEDLSEVVDELSEEAKQRVKKHHGITEDPEDAV